LNSAGPLRIVIPNNATRTEFSAAQRIAHGLQLFFNLDSIISFDSHMLKGRHDPEMPPGNIVAIGSSSSRFIHAALRSVESAFTVTDATDGVTLQFKGERIDATDGKRVNYPLNCALLTAAGRSNIPASTSGFAVSCYAHPSRRR
jgi:hypothetical protein